MTVEALGKRDPLIIRAGKSFLLGSGATEEEQARLFATLCRFLNENALSVVRLPEGEAHPWEGFELRKSHLTELGRQVMSEGLHRWLGNLDRGGSALKTAALSRALKKVSASHKHDPGLVHGRSEV